MTASASPCTHTSPAVSGLPLRILRVEGMVLLAASLATYFAGLDEAWWLVPALLLLPDVAMIGYARSSSMGALTYNLAHSYPAPALLGVWALLSDASVGQAVALIWFAHIGMDRALGYGLKYDTDFTDTHLGRIGAQADDARRTGSEVARDRGRGAAAVPRPEVPTQSSHGGSS